MSGARFVDGLASHLTTGRDTEIGWMIRALAVRAREFDSFVFTGCFCMGGGAVGGALLTALHNERLFRLEEAKHRVGGEVGWVRHGLDSGLDVCKFAVHGVDQEDGFEPVSVDRPHCFILVNRSFISLMVVPMGVPGMKRISSVFFRRRACASVEAQVFMVFGIE